MFGHRSPIPSTGATCQAQDRPEKPRKASCTPLDSKHSKPKALNLKPLNFLQDEANDSISFSEGSSWGAQLGQLEASWVCNALSKSSTTGLGVFRV